MRWKVGFLLASSAVAWTQPVRAEPSSDVALAAAADAQIAQSNSQSASPSPSPREADSNVIVVTAQRRDESAQDVPISLTAISSEGLEKANIDSIEDLPRVAPSLNVQRAPQAANTRISIRGIGSAGNAAIEPSVGAYVDGFYIPRPGPLLAGLNDLAGAEVLRGPQGTLFGRNAAIGALNFRTTLPKDYFEGSAGLDIGSFGKIRATGIINAPVSETISTRIAVLVDNSDGYGLNLENGEDLGSNKTVSVRGTAKIDLSPDVEWIIRGDYQRMTGDGVTPVTLLSQTLTPTARANFMARLDGMTPLLDADYDRRLRQSPGNDLVSDQWGVSSELSWYLGGPTLRLLSSYRDWNSVQQDRDFTLTPADLVGRETGFVSQSVSQELQLASSDEGRLTYVAGLYYFHEQYEIDADYNLGQNYCDLLIANSFPGLVQACVAGPQALAAQTRFDQNTDSLAAYGQATYDLTDNWDATLGLRYSHDWKEGSHLAERFNPSAFFIAQDAADLEFDDGKITYRLNTTYRPAPDVMLFATLSTGYKSGGFDSGAGTVLGVNRVFDPETVQNYELGAKTQWLDRRLTLNATLFRTDIDDFQLRSYDGTAFRVQNAGSIRQQGVEFEIQARPVTDLVMSLSGTRLYSEYTSFENAPNLPALGGTQDLTGQRVPYSPKWQGSGDIDYRTPLFSGFDLGLNGRVAFTSDIDVGGAADNNTQGIQPGYALLGARVTLFGPDDRYQIAFSGDNLTDKGYCTGIYGQSFGALLGLNDPATGGTAQRCILGQPRTYRISARVRF